MIATSDDILWRIETLRPHSDGRWRALMTIVPVSGSGLPKPRDLFVTCADSVSEVSASYRDGRKESGEFELIHPNKAMFSLRLPYPKLWAPAHWELVITSATDKPVEVLSVERAPGN